MLGLKVAASAAEVTAINQEKALGSFSVFTQLREGSFEALTDTDTLSRLSLSSA